jgi:hypothetical protein
MPNLILTKLGGVDFKHINARLIRILIFEEKDFATQIQYLLCSFDK